MLNGFLILFAFQAAGEGVVRGLGLPFPGPVVGMALLATALVSGLIDVRRVEQAADLLLEHLSLFVFPVIMGVLDILPTLRGAVAPMLLGNLASTVAVLVGSTLPFAKGRGR